MAQKEVQHREELQEKERTVELSAVGSDGHDERRGQVGAEVESSGRRIVEEQGAGGTTDVEKIVATKLGPIADALSRLTEQVDILAEDGVSEAKSGHAGKRAGLPDRAQQEPSHTIVDGWGGMRIGKANRLYKDNLMAAVMSKDGDSKFAAAKVCWDRLCGQFPVSETHQAKLVAHAFTGQAAAVYQQVAAANPMATAEELWLAMERRLHNAAQVQSQRGKVYEARMKRGESVEDFVEGRRELACGLPESIDDHVLQQRLIAGLLDYLKVPAATASTDVGTAVTRLELVIEAMSIGGNERRYRGGEQVNEVREVPGGGRDVDANGGDRGGGLRTGASREDPVRIR
jgi:Retrotransposon gag protein